VIGKEKRMISLSPLPNVSEPITENTIFIAHTPILTNLKSLGKSSKR